MSYDDVATVVKYTAHPQTAKVVFKDMTTDTTLTDSEVTLTGTSDGEMDFTDAKAALAELKAKYYYVVTGKDLPDSQAFDHVDDEDQTITVELRHEITDHSETKTVKSTVTYEGVKPAQAASEQTATVTHTYQIDEVTTDRIQAADSAKYAADAKYKADTYAVAADDAATINATTGDLTFNDVTSPVVPGYTADQLTVNNKTATKVATDGTISYDDVATEVKYTAHPQTAKVVFKDMTTDTTLTDSEVTLTGTPDGEMDFTDAKAALAELKAKHYYVVTGKDLPDSQAFDHVDDEDQTITVELRHEITDHSETKTVKSTVTYEGVKPAQAASEQTATVTHTYQIDEVTTNRIQAADSAKYAADAKYKADTYAVAADDAATINATTGDLTFNDVTSPVVPGYTADQLTVKNKTATKVATDGTISYDDVTAVVTYAPNTQTVKVHYDNTNLTPNQQHSVPGGESDFTMTGKTDTPYDTATVTGGPTTVPAVPGYTFTVTSNGKTVFTSDDDNPTYDFKTVTDGHNFTVTENGLTDGDYTITYTPKTVTGQVVVIDDATNESLQTDKLEGKTDADVVYDSAATIKRFTDMGYVLVSNDLSDAKMYNADDAKNRFEIHLKHNTADGTGTPTTTVRHTTITTPDGKKTTVDQTVEITPHYSVDQVTGERVPDGDLDDKTKYDNT
ncbi:mucin-binding protein [Weissella confusa]|uniref:mucin-binding protein n=1 Tax=Weissella confusa TaxID=1583 RepID=UPI002477DA20|nr:hypothetical protein [Weissella confusa]